MTSLARADQHAQPRRSYNDWPGALVTRLKSALVGLLIVDLLVPSISSAAGFGVVIKPELPVTATNASFEQAQNSPTIAVDPTDHRFVALASRVDAPAFDCALHASGDGGRTWQPSAVVPKLPEGADRCYAPEIAFDKDGTLYYTFIGLHGQGNVPMGVFLTKSVDRKPFTTPAKILGEDRFMVRMVIDNRVGDHGRIHLVWLQAGTSPPLGGLPPIPNPILAAHSDDGGKTFSSPVAVADPARPLVVAPAVALGRDGTIHVAYYDLEGDRRDYQGLDGPVWEGTWSLLVSTSTDGGRSFSRHLTAAAGLVPDERVMLIYTMPPPAIVADQKGDVWVSWWDARNGDADVFIAGSGDGGRSFRAPVRLNDDPVGDGRRQYLPRLSLAPGGRLDAIFYDRRDDPKNVDNHVYYTYSTDAGSHFSANVRLTSDSSHTKTGARYAVPSAQGLTEFGSRLGLVPIDGGVLAAWTDTRNVRHENTHQDIFATEIIGSAPESSGSPSLLLVSGGATVGAFALGLVLWNRRRRRQSV